MQKQLGRIGTVRHRYAGPQVRDSGEIQIDLPPVPSGSCVVRESQFCLSTTASPPALKQTATPGNSNVINSRSAPLVLPEKEASVLSSAGIAALDEPATTLETYREYDMRETPDISEIITMPSVAWQAWRAYRTHSRERESTIQMLALSCVLRPGDVGLRYTTPLPKVGVCIGAPDAQGSHDMEYSLYLEPSTGGMRARGMHVLRWVQHEWTTRCMPIVRRGVAVGRRWWILLIAQIYKANSGQPQEPESDAIIRLLKTQRLQPW
jgi:hypothetical protein